MQSNVLLTYITDRHHRTNHQSHKSNIPSLQRSNKFYEDILMYTWGVISHGQVDPKQMLSCFIMPSGTYIFISISRRLQCLHLSNELKTALD